MPLYRVEIIGFYENSFHVVAEGLDEAVNKVTKAVKKSGRKATLNSIEVIGVESGGIFLDGPKRLTCTSSDY